MNTNILVVDDERTIRESLSKVLHAENYEVLCAENGQEAIERFAEARIDLLLLDLGLRGNDGWATLEWLAQVNPLLPVVIITGRGNQREHAEMAGAYALMEKPLDVPRLLETMSELLNEPLLRRAQRAGHRAASFRFAPCDHRRFEELQVERFTTPCECAGLKNN